jgi:signal transduction histidine kinase
MPQAPPQPEREAFLLARLDQLRRAERRAASARMVSVAGHLAGTPLNVIAGRAALIRGSDSREAIEENVRRIEEQVDRMAQRVRRLIEYFGLGAPSPERRPVGAVLAECRELYQPLADLQGISLSIDGGEIEQLLIEADVAPLVLTSLLSLALQATRRGQAVRLKAAARGPQGVAFELTLPTLAVPVHFERFEPPEVGEQDPCTLETLWTCLGLARRLGGSLTIAQAEAGQSATVRFTCGHDGPAR